MTSVATSIAPGPRPHDVNAADEIHDLAMAGRYAEALSRATSELARRPDDAELLFARASTLFDWGRIRESREAFLRAEAHGCVRAALYLNLAWSSHLLRQTADAERYARKALAADSSSEIAQLGLATVLQRMKRYPEAIEAYERVLERSPQSSSAAAGVAYCKLEQRDYGGAEIWLRRALSLAPDNPALHVNLGVALASIERYEEAFACFRRAGTLESAQDSPPESVVDHAYTHILMGQEDAVIELLRRHLPHFHDPRAHSHYSFALLTRGDFREGFEQYEVRWLQEPHLSHRPHYAKPVWAGQRLEGKTILLRVEQGAGDVVQFARYAVPLKARGARVVLEVRPELVQLAQGLAGVDEVFAPPAPAPAFDYYVHIMGLPRAFGTEVSTIPAEVPYLRVHPDAWQRWAERIGDGGFRVGLAWAGNPLHPRDRYRSIALDELHALLSVEGVAFHSLQKAAKPGELERLPASATLVDLGPELVDFEATAAAIAQMDLVICVDTAVAHIAGALGKPVWLLLPRVGDFRWLTDRDDSPWYPTMRLFRQRVHGEWSEVVARVRSALQDAVATGVVAVLPVAAAKLPTRAEAAAGIARVAETRYGIFQYVPESGVEARSLAWYGEYAQCEVDLITRLLLPGSKVVDAGCGIAAQTVPLAQHVGAAGHIFTYEPRANCRELLQRNLDVNRVTPVVTMMRRALGGATSDATDTIDALLLDRLDLVKLGSSVNASEVLTGAADTLWRLRPLLCVHVAAAEGVHAAAALIKGFGYRCFKVVTPLFNANNFNRRDADIFAGAAAYAVLGIPEEADVRISLDECEEIVDGARDVRDPGRAKGAASSVLSRWFGKRPR